MSFTQDYSLPEKVKTFLINFQKSFSDNEGFGTLLHTLIFIISNFFFFEDDDEDVNENDDDRTSSVLLERFQEDIR